MWASQGTFAAQALATPTTAVAWKTKPTWVVIATEDKAINPALQRRMSERSGAAVTEVKASHAVFISQPAPRHWAGPTRRDTTGSERTILARKERCPLNAH